MADATLLAKMKPKHARAHFPIGTKSLRACLQCRLIMDKKQFFDLGCPACPELRMQENENRVIACTTTDFDCFVSNIRPGGFVTRFIGLEKSIPGLYANKVRGEIPPEVQFEDELDAMSVKSAIGEDDIKIPGLSDLDDSDDDAIKQLAKTPPPESAPTTSTSDVTLKTPPAAKKAPKAPAESGNKKRKVQDTRAASKPGKPQPPSVSSDVSSDADDAQPDAMAKALAFLGDDSDADSDSQARGKKAGAKDEHSEKSVVSGQVVVSAHSGSEAGSAKDVKNPSAAGASSHGTSKASEGSVAILQPDEDTEFKGAPQ